MLEQLSIKQLFHVVSYLLRLSVGSQYILAEVYMK